MTAPYPPAPAAPPPHPHGPGSRAAVRGPRGVLGLAIGAGAGLVGLVPLLLAGARLPLQNLWLEDTLDMPLSLLPVNQYYVAFIVAILVTGGVLAGIGLRALRSWIRSDGAAPGRSHASPSPLPAVAAGAPHASPPPLPTPSARATHLGLALVQAAAIGQSFWVTGQGLGVFGAARPLGVAYFWAMLAGTVAAAGIAHLVLHLTGRAPRPGAAVGWAVAAWPIGHWLLQLVNSLTPNFTLPWIASQFEAWVPPLVTCAALAWCGLAARHATRAWIGAGLLLLLVPPLASAMVSTAGTRAHLGDLATMAADAAGSFLHALPQNVLPTAVGLVLAGVIAVPRLLADRSSGRL